MRVLATTDGSEASLRALEQLGPLLRPEELELLLIHAFQLPSDGAFGAYALVVSTVDIERQLREGAEALLQQGVHVLERHGLTARTMSVIGDPASVILETAERERVDLIVVGSHGRTGLQRFLMGSVAARVVGHAPCSVLVIKARQGLR